MLLKRNEVKKKEKERKDCRFALYKGCIFYCGSELWLDYSWFFE